MQRSELQAGPNQAVVVYSPADTGSEIDNSSPAVANGVVYVGAENGQLYA